MKKRSKSGGVKGVVKRLFGSKVHNKGNVTFINRKEEYFKDYWFPKNVCIGIALIAESMHCSNKKAAVDMMTKAVANWMHKKIAEQIELDKQARERNEKPKRTRFKFLMRKYARQRGVDITKIF
jgi:hypothetical protein